MALKITTWNLEHANRLINSDPSNNVKDRRNRVKQTIEAINPDILCVIEGPKGEQAIDDFCTQVLDQRWKAVLLKPNSDALGRGDNDYKIKGTQWIWFLVREDIAERCRLQSPATWQAFTGRRNWQVNNWGMERAVRHSHYRHPQVLIFDAGQGIEIELIGVHLKSKINKKRIRRDDEGNLTGDYVQEAMKARIKLATEAQDVREYAAAKFEQVANPGLLILGDCNDGPGRDYFETRYLFFDLISNLQGEVLLAERFFNHALFDTPAQLRWSAKYRDEILKIPASKNPLLIDHILISQPLCRGMLPLTANANAGKVEHQAFERFNAGSNSKTRTSDHRPVTCTLENN